jgi:hypothetical protein
LVEQSLRWVARRESSPARQRVALAPRQADLAVTAH